MDHYHCHPVRFVIPRKDNFLVLQFIRVVFLLKLNIWSISKPAEKETTLERALNTINSFLS